ncbi:hypothetical protein MTO96_037803 [Rhipicephalus appendiculatus]
MGSFIASVLWISALWNAQAAPWLEHTTSQNPSGSWSPDQVRLFEGDIILPDDSLDDRTAVTRDTKLWPKGIIPYVFEARPNRQKRLIREAMEQIEAVSCLRFVNRTTERDYVYIDRNDTCGSSVGRKGGRQPLSLGLGCMQIGSVMHELLHVVGFHHEHSRSDRDEYVDVFLDNVQPGQEHNFKKMKAFRAPAAFAFRLALDNALRLGVLRTCTGPAHLVGKGRKPAGGGFQQKENQRQRRPSHSDALPLLNTASGIAAFTTQ